MRERPARSYTSQELLDAWHTARKWSHAHPDLVEHYSKRLNALSAAFGVDLDRVPKQPAPESEWPEWLQNKPLPENATAEQKMMHRLSRVDADWLDKLWEETNRCAEALKGPYDGYLEMPESTARFAHRHGGPISTALFQTARALDAQLIDLIWVLWGLPPDRTLTDDDLRRHGYDPDVPGPDLYDYM